MPARMSHKAFSDTFQGLFEKQAAFIFIVGMRTTPRTEYQGVPVCWWTATSVELKQQQIKYFIHLKQKCNHQTIRS